MAVLRLSWGFSQHSISERGLSPTLSGGYLKPLPNFFLSSVNSGSAPGVRKAAS